LQRTVSYIQSGYRVPYKESLYVVNNVLTSCSQYHNESVLKKYQSRLKIGSLKESAKL